MGKNDNTTKNEIIQNQGIFNLVVEILVVWILHFSSQ